LVLVRSGVGARSTGDAGVRFKVRLFPGAMRIEVGKFWEDLLKELMGSDVCVLG